MHSIASTTLHSFISSSLIEQSANRKFIASEQVQYARTDCIHNYHPSDGGCYHHPRDRHYQPSEMLFWALHMLRYTPPGISRRSACRPCSSSTPSRSTSILSQCTTDDRRWATVMVVRAEDAFRSVSMISLSANASTEDVISSHRIREGLQRRALQYHTIISYMNGAGEQCNATSPHDYHTSPRDGDLLSLSSRQPGSPLTHQSTYPLWQLLDGAL